MPQRCARRSTASRRPACAASSARLRSARRCRSTSTRFSPAAASFAASSRATASRRVPAAARRPLARGQVPGRPHDDLLRLRPDRPGGQGRRGRHGDQARSSDRLAQGGARWRQQQRTQCTRPSSSSAATGPMRQTARPTRIASRTPTTSSRIVPAGGADGRARGDRRRERRVPRVVGVAAGRAAGASSSRRPTCSRAAATRSSRCSRARPAPPSASRCSRCTSCPDLFRQAAALGYQPIGQILPVGQSRHVRDGSAQARRRRRRDRAVERGADPLGAVDRGAARARQHGRAQAVGVVAGLRRAALGRDLRRGRACPTAS